jgi:hypothetical protein
VDRTLYQEVACRNVAMKITGHKTRAVFGRYHIVSPGDLQEAAKKLTGTLPAIGKGPLSEPLEKVGGGGWIRTTDIGLMRPPLYQLSYAATGEATTRHRRVGWLRTSA